ncbi:ATP-binding protein [Acidobacteriota bacterium]
MFLKNHTIAQAILDRYLHHCEVIRMSGDSYRLKGPQRSSKSTRKPR